MEQSFIVPVAGDFAATESLPEQGAGVPVRGPVVRNSLFSSPSASPVADVTFTEGNQTNVTLTENSNADATIVARSTFKQIAGTFTANSSVDVAGIVSLYKGAPQISIISINNTPTHTAVENASVNANIYTFGNDILVETEAGNAIEVYNVQGQLLLNTVAKDGINTISGLNAGVVIVRVNGVSYKVIL